MPTAPISLQPAQADGVLPLGPLAAHSVNVVFDARGAAGCRPCVTTSDRLTTNQVSETPIVGLHGLADGRVVAVSGANLSPIYEVTAGGSRLLSAAPILGGGRRPVFAETEGLVAVAAGSFPVKIPVDGLLVASLLGGGPPRCSHIVASASRLVANSVQQDFTTLTYSAVSAGGSYIGHEDWTGLESGIVLADAEPDAVTALHQVAGELVAFGPKSVESFTSDAASQYLPVGVQSVGCAAPYSVIQLDTVFAWLDNRRRFVMGDARSHESLSAAIQASLDLPRSVDGCFGHRVQLGAIDALLWTIPEAGRTFGYSAGGWSQWQGAGGNATAQFPVTAHIKHEGKSLVGLSSGYVGELSSDATTDLGEVVTARLTTGYQTRGTMQRKQCRAVHMNLSSAAGGEVLLQYRDDDGAFCAPLVFRVDPGTTAITLTRRSLGVYRTRQWRVTLSSSARATVASLDEEYEVLGS
jgi:hypothetical protein